MFIIDIIKDHLRSQRFAWNGLREVAKNELNFQLEIFISLIVIIISLVLHLSHIEIALILSACTSVLLSEIFNTSIEKLSDVVSSEYHPIIKIVKDSAAAGVLVSAFYAFFIALLIVVPKITALF